MSRFLNKHESFLAICDANVLIDYVNADLTLLPIVSGFWKEVFVPDCVLQEVEDLPREVAEISGLTIVETPIIDLPVHKGLSIQDRVCLHYCIEKQAICLTNDISLRNACELHKIEKVWGLEMILLLVQNQSVNNSHALQIAEKIKNTNFEITEKIFKDFKQKLNKISLR